MKKIYLLIVFLAACTTPFSQPFIGMGATNKGLQIQAGFLIKFVEARVAYKLSGNANVPAILSFTAGTALKINSSVSLTPSAGIAQYKKNTISYCYEGGDVYKQISDLRPMYVLEIGKDADIWRIYANANYCSGIYFGLGIKGFMR